VSADPVEGQVAALATAELVNVWDLPSYAAFIASASITVDGEAAPAPAPLEAVEVAPQPQERPVNWLNIFYAVEWVVFAGFAFFLWWRLVADDHRRSLEDDEDAVDEDAVDAGEDPDDEPAVAGTGSARIDIDSDTASDEPAAAVRAEADDDGAARPGATHPTEAGTRE
jgi:hypothetical protein